MVRCLNAISKSGPTPEVAAGRSSDLGKKKKYPTKPSRRNPCTGSLPSPLELLPHQKEACRFISDNKRCYLGLDPGLGKTIVAAHYARMTGQFAGRVFVYICPPFLTRNVQEEFSKWAPKLKTVLLSEYKDQKFINVLIVPDSMISRNEVQKVIKFFVKDYFERVLFVDEAHRFKNEKAKRTKALFSDAFGIVDHFTRRIYMSGTPMPNRPIELYPVLSRECPEAINHMSRTQYGKVYCAGFYDGYGWDFSGASNMKDLAARVIHPKGKFMLRQKKHLLGLPPKTEEIFVVSKKMSPQLKKFNDKIGERYATVEDLIKAQIADKIGKNEEDLHMGTYRRLLGVEKVKPSVELIESILDETEESVVVFAHHVDVITDLQLALAKYRPYVVTGKTPMSLRHDYVKDFQKSKDRRLFIGNYHALGVGFTLTKATRVVSVEFDWVPGNNDQAGDRTHRIGQTKPVLHQFIVYKDSLDKVVIETLLRKRNTLKHL